MLSDIQIPWTHRPDWSDSDLLGPVMWDDDSCESFTRELPDGWVLMAVRSVGPRCGIQHPDYPEIPFSQGSCGGLPGHEHPHTWMKSEFTTVNMTKKLRHRVRG